MLIVLTALAMLRWEVPPSVCYGHVRASDWHFKSTAGDDACWDTSGVLVLLARTSDRGERPERFVVLFFGFAEHLRKAIGAQLQLARDKPVKKEETADEEEEEDAEEDDSGASLWSEWLDTYAPRSDTSTDKDKPVEVEESAEHTTDEERTTTTEETEASDSNSNSDSSTSTESESATNTESAAPRIDDNVVALGFKCEAGAAAVLALTQSPYNFEFPLNSRSMMHVDEAAARPAHTMNAEVFIAIVRMALDGFAYIHGFFQDAMFQQTLQPSLIVQQQ